MITSVLVVAVLAGAPMADVWPFQGKRLADGSTEYSYDLTALKASRGFADAQEANGEDALKKFLAGLPRQVTVKVPAGAGVTLNGGLGLEGAPLATSFALSPDGPLATENPLGKKGPARLLAPLDPRTPRVLVGAELPLWLARQVEDQALAAVEIDTEWMRRELWTKVAERALLHGKASGGDTREGAFALAARALAAASCGDPAKMPVTAKNDAELKLLVEAELARVADDGDSVVAPAPFSWTPELACGWWRARALSRPFEQSRAGTAAVLVFFSILGKDPKLANLWERTRQRRDRFLGAPKDEPALAWKSAAKGDVAKALDSLAEFIEALPLADRRPPPLVAWPTTPFSKFLAELSGPERSAAMDELTAAVGDGRVAPAGEGWPVRREAALALLLAESSKVVTVDSGWRDRLSGAFAALQGSHRDARRGGLDAEDEELERTLLKVRLNVPPLLEVEPTGGAFERQARSLEALVAALGQENLTGLKGFTVEGKRTPDTIVNDAKRLVSLLDGLAKLAQPESGGVEGKAVGDARRFIAGWRAEPGLTRDVRATFALPYAAGSERAHAAVVGVSRRELRVGYASPPKASVLQDGAPFVVNTAVEQRYLVPVLVTLGAVAPHTTRTADRGALKSAVDAAGRDLTKLDGALHESLHGGDRPRVMGTE
ncbi:MAG: hypothetical protein JNJ54_36260 [Myxococcaceae bacterium]|nr:hypothetical protein [Myxococcaceae bacterium]